MVLEHRLKNTGKKLIESDVYEHNFYMIDAQPTGPGVVINTASTPQSVSDSFDIRRSALTQGVPHYTTFAGARAAVHAIAALNLTQQAKQIATGGLENFSQTPNTGLIDGLRRFAIQVRELDIDLIDRINPFGEAYAILAKAMSEESLKQVAAAIAAKRTSLTPEEAKVIAKRAVEFKRERGRLPSISSADAWEKHLAEGAAAFVRFKDEGRYE